MLERSLRSWRLRAALAATLGLFGLVAFAHTPAGRPLLAALRGAPGCPVALDGGDPAQIESFRQRQFAQRRGARAEAARPALIFELGSTRRADVLAWSERSGVSCRSLRQDSVLRCADVPGQTLSAAPAPAIEDLHLQFDREQRLVAVDLYRAISDGPSALSWLDALDRELARRVGDATASVGEATSAYLNQHALNRVAREYRYRNYVAEVSAMNFGARGIRVRERYEWLAPSGA